jgi:hypothetical protein
LPMNRKVRAPAAEAEKPAAPAAEPENRLLSPKAGGSDPGAAAQPGPPPQRAVHRSARSLTGFAAGGTEGEEILDTLRTRWLVTTRMDRVQSLTERSGAGHSGKAGRGWRKGTGSSAP